MATIYAGISGWAYTSWRRGFYPADLSSANFLAYCATRLNSVEVNYSFRSLLTRELLQDWIRATPPGFIFAVKAPQQIAYLNRLRGDVFLFFKHGDTSEGALYADRLLLARKSK